MMTSLDKYKIIFHKDSPMPRSMGCCDPEDKMMCSSKIIHVYLFEIKRI